MTTDLKEVIMDPTVQDGFYADAGEDVAFAPNFVQWPDGELIQRADKDSYSYPVRGYYWFNTRREALSFFSRNDPDVDKTLPAPSDVMFPNVAADRIGPFPDDEDVNEFADKGAYIADVELGSTVDGHEYDPGNPPAYADDVVDDPASQPPSFA